MRHLILLSVLSVTIVSHNLHATEMCATIFEDKASAQSAKEKELKPINTLNEANLDEQLAAGYDSFNIIAYSKYKTTLEKYPDFEKNKKLNSAIKKLLKDEALSSYHIILEKAFNKIIAAPQVDHVQQEFQKEIYEQISKFMSLDKAKERVEILNKENINVNDLKQALGEMTFQESLEALVGTGGIENLQGDSLVQRYLDAAKEKGVDVSTFLGAFKKGPGYEGRGGQKLYISVDSKTVGLLESIIGDNPHLLMHNHSPYQGTLYMRYRGNVNSYATAGYYPSPMKTYLPVGSILPVIPLSGVEASNTINYFQLGRVENKYAKYPWAFSYKNENQDVQKESYCRIGGYGSCTHWVGEMAIGEKFVSEYTLPGYVGDDPYGHGQNGGGRRKGPRTQEVGQFNVFTSRSTVTEIGTTLRKDRLARIVWTQGAGREQLWSMVGDENAEGLAKGEWANPGWVIYNFLTRTSQERVPVVFVFRRSASVKLTEKSLDNFTSKISPR